ncbi:RING finger and CHY zinc finger domain-containing protein [Spironucleus salmonicida]|uniref:RING finger and CHY zinc finger domain-containing protein n=1 Tax=Spironucleus salmonicida TaxID=348837 RepID=V6LXJ9_9EUKA|nr:RING finger and CHY zinc finger domain-containing protein [Spironucleus salmonicida]|eukprot:EST45544.1 RING finger and CHY zinc finger domain-containing protein [Spironucleus salmonicida]
MPEVLVMEIGTKDPATSDFVSRLLFNFQVMDDNKAAQQRKLVGRVQPFVTEAEYDFTRPYFENLLLIQRNDGKEPQANSPMLYRRYSVQTAPFGCQHYLRACEVVCPQCTAPYPCRFCHDEEQDHELPFREVARVVCCSCQLEQDLHQVCDGCGQVFGDYYCEKCALFDSLGNQAKPIFHSGSLCRVGVAAYYRDCTLCGQCILRECFDSHVCKQEDTCPVCLGTLRDSIYLKSDLPCGHQLHQHCLQGCYDDGNYSCPICRKSTLTVETKQKIKENWLKFIKKIKVPLFLKGLYSEISCNDCQQIFIWPKVNYGYCCPNCDSLNTFETQATTRDNFISYIKGIEEPIINYMDQFEEAFENDEG